MELTPRNHSVRGSNLSSTFSSKTASPKSMRTLTSMASMASPTTELEPDIYTPWDIGLYTIGVLIGLVLIHVILYFFEK